MQRRGQSESTHTVYNGENAWADFSQAGAVTARYLFGDGLDSNEARWRPTEGIAWYLTDHLGSIRDIVDSVGTLVDHIEYDSFGNIVLETNAQAGDRFKYTGREWSEDLGLYYYRARFYDGSNGRFISQDPIGFEGGDTNLYRYVGNSPLTFTDPTGNESTGYGLTLSAFVAPLLTTFEGCVVIAVGSNIAIDTISSLALNGGQNPYETNGVVAQTASYGIDIVAGVASCMLFPPTKVAMAGFAVIGTAIEAISARAIAAGATATVAKSLALEGTFAFAKIGDGGGCKSSLNETGSYTNTHASGKTYTGKGTRKRSQTSGAREAKVNNDPHVATDFTAAEGRREAFKQESRRLDELGGAKCDSNFNRIESPGKNYRIQDGELPK